MAPVGKALDSEVGLDATPAGRAALVPLDQTPLTAIERHVVTFSESGILCLSERDITAVSQLQLARLAPNSATLVLDLDLSGNRISELSHSELLSLRALTVLDLSANQLEHIPPAICQLEALEELNMNRNMILAPNVPTAEEMALGLRRLRELDLSNNRLAFLPEGLLGLPALQRLDLSRNRMEHSTLRATAVHPAAGDAPAPWACLTTLDLSHNGMVRVPTLLAHCAVLRKLDLSHNRLPDVPPDLGAMHELEHLALVANRLRALPLALGRARALHTMPLGDNPLLTRPPPLVVALGTKAVLGWLRDAEEDERTGAVAASSVAAERARDAAERAHGVHAARERATWETTVQAAVKGAMSSGGPSLTLAERSQREVEGMTRNAQLAAERRRMREADAARRDAAARHAALHDADCAAVRAALAALERELTAARDERNAANAEEARAAAELCSERGRTDGIGRMLAGEREALAGAIVALDAARAGAVTVPRNFVEEIKSLDRPPEAVRRALEALKLVLDGVPQSRVARAAIAAFAAARPEPAQSAPADAATPADGAAGADAGGGAGVGARPPPPTASPPEAAATRVLLRRGSVRASLLRPSLRAGVGTVRRAPPAAAAMPLAAAAGGGKAGGSGELAPSLPQPQPPLEQPPLRRASSSVSSASAAVGTVAGGVVDALAASTWRALVPPWEETRAFVLRPETMARVGAFPSGGLSDPIVTRLLAANLDGASGARGALERAGKASKAVRPLLEWVLSEVDFAGALASVDALRARVAALEAARDSVAAVRDGAAARCAALAARAAALAVACAVLERELAEMPHADGRGRGEDGGSALLPDIDSAAASRDGGALPVHTPGRARPLWQAAARGASAGILGGIVTPVAKARRALELSLVSPPSSMPASVAPPQPACRAMPGSGDCGSASAASGLARLAATRSSPAAVVGRANVPARSDGSLERDERPLRTRLATLPPIGT
ncbi:hypothetical protein KFE25_003617 [Diacronema lutheri]|uniref:Uncharacterized protein n=1 Tax=Diacronema lutheri TaxID=2081491 RepID=A0A8J6CB26_DIALT|nr:hypothetical protein KFE25_003617 [Diacronema lutheri]